MRRPPFFRIYRNIGLLNLSTILLFVGAYLWCVGETFPKANPRDLSPTSGVRKSTETPRPATPSSDRLLPLFSRVRSFPFFALEKELFLPACDAETETEGSCVRIGFATSGRIEKLRLGKRVYLAYSDPSGPSLSKTITPLWIIPHFEAPSGIRIEAGLLLPDEGNGEGRRFCERAFFHPARSPGMHPTKEEGADLSSMREALARGKAYGRDLLFATYGGAFYRQRTTHERVEPGDATHTSFYLKRGDGLVWKEARFVREEPGSHHLPEARVRAITDSEIEWLLREVAGEEGTIFIQKKENTPPPANLMEETFSEVRKRTASRTSCRLKGKKVVLKPGDWLLHTPRGWHVADTLREVEAVLHFRWGGELFVFDGIEERGGRSCIKGTLFNPPRTQKRVIVLPIPLRGDTKKTDSSRM
ncbi:MAG: hypothetical protein OXF02_03320 [Simkaniaceae bacterium]|nr:hypothetical protein [Simkaniaceae bacterium]